MSGLEVHGLVKRLGDHAAVDGLSFEVAEGEFLVLLGPSGCGKSTTLRMICGLEQPDAGRIVIAGREVTTLPSRERNLGMVFQEYGLYPSMDVFGNLAYGLQAQGKVSAEEIERRIGAAAERLGLTPLLSSPITDLSGGEQQRVALGRAMVKDADAYLYDEPLSNLDPKLRHRIRRDIMAIHREKGRPSVYVTHDQSEAFAMGDRVAVIAQGKVQQMGTAVELAEDPANVFVASFIGSPAMNLVPVEIREASGGLAAVAAGLTVPVPERLVPALDRLPGREAILGLPPAALRLDGAGEGVIDAQVTDMEALIGETVVKLKAPHGALHAVFRDGEEEGLAAGGGLRLSVIPNDVRLFDPATERVLRG